MRVLTFPPSAKLTAFVRSYTVVETAEEATRTLLPDTGVVLGIRYGGFARQLDEDPTRCLPDATLAGMRTSTRRMYTSARAGIVLVTFHTAGAVAVFAEPLHELFGKTAALDELVPASELARAADRIGSGRDHAERISSMECFLLDRLRAGKGDPLVAASVRAIRDAHGAVRVGELAARLSISRDRLEKRFRHAVGASPKQLAVVLRVRRAIELHRAGATFTEAALEAGYFDQSHFIREFRRVTGHAPREFFGGGEHC